uniref:Uncharacterized protein n=1 Tax=Proboscia inermis TaxID=420281 RepID=A0A7S0G7D0_9STRA|mmetsp:Transcript_36014/g.43384  ORF Transcript_36014/g.43384 Transcript_36014/m.43384 type:complete len:172 (+) Transcript_36014:74-589(+)
MTIIRIRFTEALFIFMILLPLVISLRQPTKTSLLSRRSFFPSLVFTAVARPRRSWGGGWESYKAASSTATTAEIIAEATEKATDLLVETLPSGPSALPPLDARSMARECYLECFKKFGDSIVPATEYDVSVYCTSRCFETVATRAFGLQRGSEEFCRAYVVATELEFYGCE